MSVRLCSLLPALLIAGALAAPASAQALAAGELHRLLAADVTPADHARLAAHYRARAAEQDDDARVHLQLAERFGTRLSKDDASWDLARDASHYAEHARDAAEALRDLAAQHAALAGTAAGEGDAHAAQRKAGHTHEAAVAAEPAAKKKCCAHADAAK